MQTVDKIGLILPTLDMTQLRQLNSMVVGQMNSHQHVKQMQAMVKLRVGAIAEFTSSKLHKVIRVRITKLNLKTVSARQINIPDGTDMMATWKVAPSLLTMVA